MPDPAVELDGRVEAEVLDVLVANVLTGPDPRLPAAGREPVGTLDAQEISTLQD